MQRRSVALRPRTSAAAVSTTAVACWNRAIARATSPTSSSFDGRMIGPVDCSTHKRYHLEETVTNEALPRWLGPASRVNMWLLRRGLRIGTQHVLSVPGRKSGLMRSTPVSLVTLDGVRYIVSGEGLAWVANAR